jgi:hypothetical protein
MSTFTRLYFTNRGPNIADSDDQDAPEAAGEGFVSPETIPLDPDHKDREAVRERGLAELAFLPHLPEVLRRQRSPAFSQGEGWAEDDRDAAR